MATQNNSLPVAQPGDTIQGADLQASIDMLRERAQGIADDIPQIADVQEAQAALRLQTDLIMQANALVNRQIDLLAGEAKISAQQVNDATRYANDVIKKITRWRKRLQLAAKVLGFVGAVMTGNGKAILTSARDLKASLDEAEGEEGA
jgi:hypothetical protein